MFLFLNKAMKTARYILGAGLLLSIIGVWLWYKDQVPGWYPKGEDAGTFGDSFGALNTLFTGLAFAAVVISVWFQRADLNATLKEIKDQTGISAAQLEASKVQTKIAALTAILNARVTESIKYADELARLLEEKKPTRTLYEQLGGAKREVFVKGAMKNCANEIERLQKTIEPLLGLVPTTYFSTPDYSY